MTNEKYSYQRFGDFTQGVEFKFLTRKILSILDHYIWHVGEKNKNKYRCKIFPSDNH